MGLKFGISQEQGVGYIVSMGRMPPPPPTPSCDRALNDVMNLCIHMNLEENGMQALQQWVFGCIFIEYSLQMKSNIICISTYQNIGGMGHIMKGMGHIIRVFPKQGVGLFQELIFGIKKRYILYMLYLYSSLLIITACFYAQFVCPMWTQVAQ